MADMRCFSRKIVESARFLKMPVSSQNLYFHLLLNADSDGIVEAYSVLCIVKANEDDLRILAAKKFIVVLNEDLVSFIVDWLENNTSEFLRKDRNSDSRYRGLLLEVYPEAKLLQRVPRKDTSNKGRKFNGQSADSPRTTQRKEIKNEGKKNNFNISHQRQYDENEYEKMLLTTSPVGGRCNECK